MGFFGNLLGQGLGGLAGSVFGNRDAGSNIGGSIGANLLPFGRGGQIPSNTMMYYQKGGKVKKSKKSKSKKKKSK